MSNESKFLKLLESLKEATAQGRIRWEDTADEKTFQTHVGRGMVRVGKGPAFEELESGEEAAAYVASLLSRDGNIVDELAVRGGSERAVLSELYEVARRTARNADELLDSMLKDLGGRTAK